jgi:uncharacterized protein YoaH (UPF0181 family)
LGTITRGIETVGKIKELAASGLSSDEVLAQALVELDAMIAEFQQAVLGVQNLDSEG